MDERVVVALERIAAGLEGVNERLDKIVEGNTKLVAANFRARMLRQSEHKAIMEDLRRDCASDGS